jgi:hypothetical protein
MRLYFDTNVYRFITAAGEAAEVRDLLENGNHAVVASNDNLFETFAIVDSIERLTELRTLTGIASTFERYPPSWYHALELRWEIARCRSQWLRKAIFTKGARAFLRTRRQLWADARTLNPPPADAYAAYRRDFERGVGLASDFQKSLRARFRQTASPFFLVSGSKVEMIEELSIDDPEIYWRVDCLLAWFNAIVTKSSASRDYRDWLAPYLKPRSFEDPTYLRFWLDDVIASRLPRNRLTALVSYYQLYHKVNHGNPMDQLHANHLLDADLFLTADRTFYKVLCQVRERHFPATGRLALLNRAAPSALNEIAAALNHLDTSGPDSFH